MITADVEGICSELKIHPYPKKEKSGLMTPNLAGKVLVAWQVSCPLPSPHYYSQMKHKTRLSNMLVTQNWEGYVIGTMTKQYKNDLTRLECWSKTTNVKFK